MTCFFAGGSQRSGTTLLQTILCQDADTNPLIQEAKYLRHLVASYKFGAVNFDAETRDYFKDKQDFRDFNTRLVREFLQSVLQLFPGKKHLVLREPHLTMLFPELSELLPDAKFICTVRDPRDVVASMVTVGAKLHAQGVNDSMARLFNSHDMAALSRHYLSFYEPVLACRTPGFKQRLLFVRYENLVQQPDSTVDSIRKFTGLALAGFDPARDPDTGKVDHGRGSRYQQAWKTEHDGKKISDDSIGRYREILTPAETAGVEKHCAAFMKHFQYA